MADTINEAWHKGYDAGANREPESRNPYSKGSLYHAWLEGYRKGIDPDHDEKAAD